MPKHADPLYRYTCRCPHLSKRESRCFSQKGKTLFPFFGEQRFFMDLTVGQSLFSGRRNFLLCLENSNKRGQGGTAFITG